MALALPSDGKLVACDVSEPSFEVARKYWAEAGVEHLIEERLGDAKATLDDVIAAYMRADAAWDGIGAAHSR